MSQVFLREEKDGELSNIGNVIQIQPDRVTVGGRQLVTDVVTSVDMSTNGVNGLDIGTLQPYKVYNLFAVNNSGVRGVVGSLNAAPLGFSVFKKIGTFGTGALGAVIGASLKTVGSLGDIKKSRLTEAQFIQENGAGWVLYDGRDITNSKLAAIIGVNVLEDARGIFLRGKNNGRADGNENPSGELAIGTSEVDALGSHNHSINVRFTGFAGGGATTNIQRIDIANNATVTQLNPSGGNETRPKNLTINIFIKIN